MISLYAKGLTTGELGAHLDEIYGIGVSRGDDLEDHRRGGDRHDGVAEPAPRRGLDSSGGCK